MALKIALLLWTAVALSASLAAGQDQSELAPWIAKLRDADPAQQEIARRVLLARGTPALAELRRALPASGDAEAKARLTGVIREIERREPHGLFFHVGMPKMRLTLDLVNGEAFRYAVTVRNRGDKTVVLWPYLKLRLLDAAGNEVARTTRIGRFGRRRSENLLEDIRFVTLEPLRVRPRRPEAALRSEVEVAGRPRAAVEHGAGIQAHVPRGDARHVAGPRNRRATRAASGK
ncbi:MAG: hypothetical protein ACYTDU_20180 [Planctomycetota bacterium]|jgi:hypothetical protein